MQSVFPFRGELLPSICLQFQVSLTQARIDMSELDEDGDGFLQPQVLTAAL